MGRVAPVRTVESKQQSEEGKEQIVSCVSQNTANPTPAVRITHR